MELTLSQATKKKVFDAMAREDVEKTNRASWHCMGMQCGTGP